MKKITIYSTTSCPYCVMLAKWLKDNNVEYTEYKIDQNPIAAQNMVRLSGQYGVPFTTIEDKEGNIDKVLGFDRTKLKQILNL